jgi:hypothetical protein
MAAKIGLAQSEAPIGLYTNDVFTSVLISSEEEAKWGSSVSRMSKKQVCGRILNMHRSAQLGNFLSGHPEVSENYT